MKEKVAEIEMEIEKIYKTKQNLSSDMEYELNQRYLKMVQDSITAYTKISLENKKDQYESFVSVLEDVKTRINTYLVEIDKEKLFEFQKNLNVLKERSRL